MTSEFHRYTITMTILVDGDINSNLDPGDIWLEAMEGEYVGTWDISKDEILDSKEMADALYAAGSEPGFFQIDDDGFSTDDEELDEDELESEVDENAEG
jgi:hypothetical protein